MTRAEKIEAASREVLRELTRHGLGDQDGSLSDAARALRAALSEEEGTPADCQVLTQAQIHDAGFRAGVEAAAVEAENGGYNGRYYAAKIRALSPSPATPSEASVMVPCGRCGGERELVVPRTGQRVRCSCVAMQDPDGPAPSEAPECQECGGAGRRFGSAYLADCIPCGGSGRATPRGQG